MLENKNPLEHYTPSLPVVLFLGSALNFSDTLVQMVTKEISDVKFIRVNDLGQLQHSLKLHSEIPLIVLDETTAHYLSSEKSEYVDMLSAGQIALAYRNKHNASQVFADLLSTAHSKDISAFPLNIQLEVFISIMKIMICGERYVHCELTLDNELHSRNTKPAVTNGRDGLTERELQVLSLVAEGKQNKAVAHELDLSEHTVKLHMHNVLSKLGLANRTEASAWFHSNAPSLAAGVAK